MMRYRCLMLLCLCGPAACVPVGPDYVAPDGAPSAHFSGAEGQAPAGALDDWWRRLGSKELNRFVEEALAQNLDIAIACERLREARSLRKEAASAFLPQAGSNLSFTRYRFDEPDVGGIADISSFFGSPIDIWSSGFDVSWEADVFGGRQRQYEAAGAREDAARESLHGVRLAVASEAVDAWVTLAGLREQLATVDRQVELQQSQTRETRERVEAGALSQIDLDRSVARLETTRLERPPLESGIVSQLRRLALLLGSAPSSLDGKGVAVAKLPASLPMTRTGIPAELLLRRPDLREAERELAAATADVGVAVANFYPKFTFGATATGYGSDLGDLFDASNYVFQYGPRVEWSLFSGGANRAALEGADARERAALLEYEKAVLKAVAEVETELAALQAESRRLAIVQRARIAAAKAARRVRENHAAGAVAYFQVLEEEERVREVEITEVRVKSQMLQAWIRLHKALGGGWEPTL